MDNLQTAFRFHLQRAPRYPAASRSALALQLARQDVATGKRRYPGPVKPFPAVAWAEPVRVGNLPFPQYSKRGMAYVQDNEPSGLRYVGRVQAECGGRNGMWDSHDMSGWYSRPDDYDSTVYGVVYQLPARDGQSRFVAGYKFSENDGGPVLDLGKVYTSESGGTWGSAQDDDAAQDAARAADSMAKAAAEEEREYQTAWRAGSDYAQERETVTETRASLRKLLSERRAAMRNPAITDSGYFALCDAIRAQVRSMLGDIYKARETMRKLASGESEELYFWTGEKRLQDAFCEGAGLDAFPVN